MDVKPKSTRAPEARSLHSGDGATVDPSEARIRRWVTLLALLAGPPLLLFVYYRLMFGGLIHSEAMDFAQLGRNLASGRGFTTYVIRPLALTHGSNAVRQPEVMHGPLYPFLLSLAFAVTGPKDSVVALLSGLFYLLTLPVVYLLGKRMFGATVGLLAAAITAVSSGMLEYATSGLHITLYTFLLTSLLLVLQRIATQSGARVPRGQLALAGALTAALYLTDPIFFWLLPVALAAVLWVSPQPKAAVAGYFMLPLAVLTLPWMARNWQVAGNPLFGLRGAELWMWTHSYPVNLAYRMTPDEVIASPRLLGDVLAKWVRDFTTTLQALPQGTMSWVLPFFLPGLFVRFKDEAANRLRIITLASLGAVWFGALLFHIEMTLLVALMPALLIFAVAFLVHLAQQAQLSRGGTLGVMALGAVICALPLVHDLAFVERHSAQTEAESARALAKMARADELAISDQPWLVAWYADRPAIWIPRSDSKTLEVRNQFPRTRWLYLTEQSVEFSPQWRSVYQAFLQWNHLYQQALAEKKQPPAMIRIDGGGHPLLQALHGFVSVQPVESAADAPVLAALPVSQPSAREHSPAGSRVASGADTPSPARN